MSLLLVSIIILIYGSLHRYYLYLKHKLFDVRSVLYPSNTLSATRELI